jgi:hypothetical protein
LSFSRCTAGFLTNEQNPCEPSCNQDEGAGNRSHELQSRTDVLVGAKDWRSAGRMPLTQEDKPIEIVARG